MIQREHIRQRFARSFVRDALECQHVFASFDSAKRSSVAAWNREKARGVIGGFPDSGLFVSGLPPLWFEWKDRGKKPDERQHAVGGSLVDLGHRWAWGWSIVAYAEWLAEQRVPMRPNAMLLAQIADTKAEAEIAKKEGAKPRSYRPARKPTRGVAKLNAARAAGII